MPRYLLSTQSVLDIAVNRNLPAQRWYDTAESRQTYNDDIYISAVTPMRLLRELEDAIAAAKQETTGPTVLELKTTLENARLLINQFANDDRIVAMDWPIAERWGWLLDTPLSYVDADGNTRAIKSAQKIELATAMVGRDNIPFVYVDRAQPDYKKLSPLSVEDPAGVLKRQTP